MFDTKSISIATGRHYSVSREDVGIATILSIYFPLVLSVTFYPYHCTFQNLQMKRRIDLNREHNRSVYMLVRDDIPSGLASIATDVESSLL